MNGSRPRSLSRLAFDDDAAKISLFAAIWGQLSEDSRDIVKAHKDWEQADAANDPLELWNIVQVTHVACTVGIDAVDKVMAEERFNQLRQQLHEPLPRFKERFDAAILSMRHLGCALPEDVQLAAKFILKLDDSRYSAFKCDLHNLSRLRGEDNVYPKTYVEAYSLALNRLEAKPKPNPFKPQAAFVAMSERKGNQDRRKEPGKQQQHRDAKDHRHSKEKKEKKFGCNICNDPDHFARDCPHRDLVTKLLAEHQRGKKALVAAAVEEQEYDPDEHYAYPVVEDLPELVFSTASGGGVVGPLDVILDNGATSSIFYQKALLSNIRQADQPVTFNGLGGSCQVDKVGDTKYFGQVYYSPESKVNVLALSDTEREHDVIYVKGKYFKVGISPTTELTFSKRPSGLYVCRLPPFSRARRARTSAEHAFVTTVALNEALYTKREVSMARRAHAIARDMGYATPESLVRLARTGGIINLPVTAEHFDRARRIYGPSIDALGQNLQR